MVSLSRARQFVTHVVPAVMRPARIIWNQLIALFFLILAAGSVPSLVRSVREFDGDVESLFRVTLTVVFVLIMSAFAMSSFLRARKISRS